MGSWGPGIFDDDLALDVRAAFEREMEEHANVATATRHVLSLFARVAKDPDDAAVAYLALASLQLEREFVQQNVRTKAIRII